MASQAYKEDLLKKAKEAKKAQKAKPASPGASTSANKIFLAHRTRERHKRHAKKVLSHKGKRSKFVKAWAHQRRRGDVRHGRHEE